jgi:hypothetical protein
MRKTHTQKRANSKPTSLGKIKSKIIKRKNNINKQKYVLEHIELQSYNESLRRIIKSDDLYTFAKTLYDVMLHKNFIISVAKDQLCGINRQLVELRLYELMDHGVITIDANVCSFIRF